MVRHIGKFFSSVKTRVTVTNPPEPPGEAGSVLLETALVLPIILLLMTGIFSFSVALYQKEELAHGVSTASRFLAIDAGATDPCADTASALYASAPTLSRSQITLSFVLDGVSYAGTTCSGTTHLITGHTAQLTATYPCSLSWYGSGPVSCSLRESITEVVQ